MEVVTGIKFSNTFHFREEIVKENQTALKKIPPELLNSLVMHALSSNYRCSSTAAVLQHQQSSINVLTPFISSDPTWEAIQTNSMCKSGQDGTSSIVV